MKAQACIARRRAGRGAGAAARAAGPAGETPAGTKVVGALSLSTETSIVRGINARRCVDTLRTLDLGTENLLPQVRSASHRLCGRPLKGTEDIFILHRHGLHYSMCMLAPRTLLPVPSLKP